LGSPRFAAARASVGPVSPDRLEGCSLGESAASAMERKPRPPLGSVLARSLTVAMLAGEPSRGRFPRAFAGRVSAEREPRAQGRMRVGRLPAPLFKQSLDKVTA
jgi:hypothetical protein